MRARVSIETESDDSEQQKTIVLKPLNPGFQPIVIDASEYGAVRSIAEFVRVL